MKEFQEKKMLPLVVIILLFCCISVITFMGIQTTVYPSSTRCYDNFTLYPISDMVFISTTAGNFKILKGEVYRQEGYLEFTIKGDCMIIAYKDWKIKTATIIREHCPDVYVGF